jgi:hypothetical protein
MMLFSRRLPLLLLLCTSGGCWENEKPQKGAEEEEEGQALEVAAVAGKDDG